MDKRISAYRVDRYGLARVLVCAECGKRVRVRPTETVEQAFARHADSTLMPSSP